MALAKYAYLNGAIVPWEKATVHAYTPLVKYGASVFEGIRGYWREDEEEMYVFRLAEHMERLVYSQTVMRFAEIVDPDHIAEQALALLRANEFRETVHIRPTVYLDGTADSSARGPVGLIITAVPRPLPKRVEVGCSVQVSSWLRASDRATPIRVKASGNYNNGRFAAIQASEDGYDAALMINAQGKVSEGPGMCFFMIRKGVPITPSITNDILESITRETLITLFSEHFGQTVVERDIDRSELYAAEEAFFCGTGWEVTPITSIDRLPVGAGGVGAVTKRLQQIYFDVAHARVPEHAEWRTPVFKGAAHKAAE